MKKRKEFLAKTLAGAMAASLVVTTLPVTAFAVTGDQVAADGIYDATVTVVNDSDDQDEWDDYEATVKLTVENGVYTAVDISATTTDSTDLKCLNWAKEGRTKSGTTYNGIDNIVGKAATEATINDYVDVVTGATCASRDLITAAKEAIAKADEASEKESQVRYVTMNVPYELFWEAYGVTDANIEEIQDVEYDAISTATTSKFTGTTGLAEGTYNDGTNMLGVTLPVAVDGDDYAELKTGLTENDNFYFTDLEEDPDYYSTLTVNEDGSYSFSALEESDVDVSSISLLKDGAGNLADLLVSSYGDYYLELEGLTPDGIISATGVDLKIYGAYLAIDDNTYGMVALENLWFGTRYDYLQIAWSIRAGKQLHKAHNNASAPLYYQFDHNGGNLTGITLITDQGLVTIEVDEILPEYYEGDLSNLTYSIANNSKNLAISGIPEDLADVTISVSENLAVKATISDGVVALSDYPKDGVSYTLTISSSNYPDITRTMSTPISQAQKDELAALVEKAQGTTGYDSNALLQEHVGEAQDMIAANVNTSVEAAELVGELEILIKQTYPVANVNAVLKDLVLTVELTDADGNNLELNKLDNPVYTLSYRNGRKTETLASGDLDALSLILDTEPTVGTEYTLTIVSDNYQDITTTVTAEEAEVPTPVEKKGALSDEADSNGNWYYYYEDGTIAKDVTTVAKNKNGWWYVENGKVNFKYTGFASNENGDWYVVNGAVKFDQNSVFKDTSGVLGDKGAWYYVKGSEVQDTYTGVADYKNANGWWYVVNGKVDFTATTVAKNQNGWWKVTNGKVDFGYTGIAKNANGWWRIVNGKVDFGCNSVEKNENGWWYIRGGKVDFTYTGVAKNANGWWRIENGKVNFNFNGIAQNQNGWWYIQGGKVNFNYNGTVTSNGTAYRVTNGKVAR